MLRYPTKSGICVMLYCAILFDILKMNFLFKRFALFQKWNDYSMCPFFYRCCIFTLAGLPDESSFSLSVIAPGHEACSLFEKKT